MLNYVIVYLLRVKYGLEVYISREIVSKLEQFFENVSDLPVAERELCGYGRYHRELQREIIERGADFYESEVTRRRNTPGSRSESGEEGITNSKSYYEQTLDLNNKDLAELTSFPWEGYNEDFQRLESPDIQRGRAVILYPFGLSLFKIDGVFGKYLNYHMEDVPGIMDFTLKSFVFKKKLRDTSQAVLRAVAEAFRSKNPEKFKKRQDITFVGVHHRRGDHISLQREGGLYMLGPGYFLDTMAWFREKYRRVAFVYVSDDMKWAEEKLVPRLKTKDLFLAGMLQDPAIAQDPSLSSLTAGYDLSLLASCNHTIQSHGSYSFWAGFLAGRGRGRRLTPRLYQQGHHGPLHPRHQPPRFYYLEGSNSNS